VVAERLRYPTRPQKRVRMGHPANEEADSSATLRNDSQKGKSQEGKGKNGREQVRLTSVVV